MLVDFPRWAVWVLNIAVLAVLTAFGYFLKWAGIEFAIGWLCGFTFCYIVFKNWRQDYDETPKPERVFHEPLIGMADLLPKSDPPPPPRSRDLTDER